MPEVTHHCYSRPHRIEDFVTQAKLHQPPGRTVSIIIVEHEQGLSPWSLPQFLYIASTTFRVCSQCLKKVAFFLEKKSFSTKYRWFILFLSTKGKHCNILYQTGRIMSDRGSMCMSWARAWHYLIYFLVSWLKFICVRKIVTIVAIFSIWLHVQSQNWILIKSNLPPMWTLSLAIIIWRRYYEAELDRPLV